MSVAGNWLFNFGSHSLHQEFKKLVNLTAACQPLTFMMFLFFFSATQMWKKSKTSCPYSPATRSPYYKPGTFYLRPGTCTSCHHHFISHPDLMVKFPCIFQPSHYINFSPSNKDPAFFLSAHPIPPVLMIIHSLSMFRGQFLLLATLFYYGCSRANVKTRRLCSKILLVSGYVLTACLEVAVHMSAH